mmetsp:Transcript_7496/g.12041  ORF Transcript_7496/g.12041 Transcript_7496/m.12041 type:complete len:543 (-) Transcript_7496:44-1672(-)
MQGRGVRGFAAKHRVVTGKSTGGPIKRLVICMGLAVVCLILFGLSVVDLNSSPAVHNLTPDDVDTNEEKNLFAEQNEDLLFEEAISLTLYSELDCKGDVVKVYQPLEEELFGQLVPLCRVKYKSMIYAGPGEVQVFGSCSEPRSFSGTLRESDGCIKKYGFPAQASARFMHLEPPVRQISQATLDKQWEMQDHKPARPTGGVPRTRIVFSCESKEYFGYQVWANYYGYLTSGQKSASWTRLMTAGGPDDLPDVVPGLATFTAFRGLFANRYGPINKPDVITKWFESPDAPREEVVAVIDPDNWLVRDISKYSDMVTKGNAIGEPAYYHGSRTAQKLWKELCLKNCDTPIDLVGVPYFIHRDDLKVVAPLWRSYTIEIKNRADRDEQFKDKYKRLDIAWAAEMFGYNMACAHAGVKTKVVFGIQVRDVAGERTFERNKDVSMIHMGRAWFPHDYKPAQKWAHTEGKMFSNNGQQVWCKCNFTAADIIPWPLPKQIDFQSYHTLTILHNAFERFGPIPLNRKYRGGKHYKPSGSFYGRSYDFPY